MPEPGLASLPTACCSNGIFCVGGGADHHLPRRASAIGGTALNPSKRKSLAPWTTSFQNMHLNRSGVEGLVSHRPRSGGDPRQRRSVGVSARGVVCSNRATCWCSVNMPSTSERSPGHRTPGFCVSMHSTNRRQAWATSRLGLLPSPDASGRRVSLSRE